MQYAVAIRNIHICGAVDCEPTWEARQLWCWLPLELSANTCSPAGYLSENSKYQSFAGCRTYPQKYLHFDKILANWREQQLQPPWQKISGGIRPNASLTSFQTGGLPKQVQLNSHNLIKMVLPFAYCSSPILYCKETPVKSELSLDMNRICGNIRSISRATTCITETNDEVRRIYAFLFDCLQLVLSNLLTLILS